MSPAVLLMIVVGFFGGVAMVVAYGRRLQVRHRLETRLGEPHRSEEYNEPDEVQPDELSWFELHAPTILYVFAGLTIMAVVVLVFRYPLGAAWSVALAFGCLAFVLYRLVYHWWLGSRRNRSESDLADALDLMVSALRTGAALNRAFEFALQSAREPLASVMLNVLGNLRLGESPDQALNEAVKKLKVESMRLFSITLQAHAQTGGSLAPALSRTAASIRDKVEVGRRVAGETSQARMSVLALFGIVYAVTWVVWRQDPGRVSSFVQSSVGSTVVAMAVFMQAFGVVWMQRLTKVDF